MARRDEVATDITSLTFAAEDGGMLPAYAPGAHIDVKLDVGLPMSMTS